MTTHLILVDPAIVDHIGHYPEYARAIQREAQKQALEFSLLAHREVTVDLKQSLAAIPTFQYGYWHRFTQRRKLRWLVNPLLANLCFYRDLRRATAHRVSRDTLFFMPTIDHHFLLAWAWWLRIIPAHRRPTVVVLFRYTYFYGDNSQPWRDAWWAQAGYRLLQPFINQGIVRLATDSRRLARQFESLGMRPWEVLPIPHTDDVYRAAAKTELNRAHRPLRFVSLGDARPDKGFPALAALIRRIAVYAPGRLDDLEFIIQSPIAHPSHLPMLPYRNQLEQLGHPNVRTITNILSRPDYIQLLLSADAVLLPYERGTYYARTSGPFTEALAAGKPVVATDDTWMSDELKLHGAGALAKDGDVEDLARAVFSVQANYAQLAALAKQRQSAWNVQHSAEALVKALRVAA